MKIRKVLSVLFAATLTLTLSQSAFAISGQNDTRETALNVQSSNFNFGSYLDKNDVDWFKVVNTSRSKEMTAIATLKSQQYINYDIVAYYPDKGEEEVLEAQDNGQGKNDVCGTSGLLPGDVIYFKVIGHDGAWGGNGKGLGYSLNIKRDFDR
ncbi:hypothetical protein PPM_2739 [Paenibacillus polymyxa M1]|uniref:hypothetical protein n=1 Tax=Paenibacillus polymyxa TaxID=1406 RepID=UPI00021BBDCC|nr:hypothetical protein [Paenibacillus polymyxa]CCC85676.1 hypothetical protein PPM_2739 [Paenibacillus polymyxa M1]